MNQWNSINLRMTENDINRLETLINEQPGLCKPRITTFVKQLLTERIQELWLQRTVHE